MVMVTKRVKYSYKQDINGFVGWYVQGFNPEWANPIQELCSDTGASALAHDCFEHLEGGKIRSTLEGEFSAFGTILFGRYMLGEVYQSRNNHAEAFIEEVTYLLQENYNSLSDMLNPPKVRRLKPEFLELLEEHDLQAEKWYPAIKKLVEDESISSELLPVKERVVQYILHWLQRGYYKAEATYGDSLTIYDLFYRLKQELMGLGYEPDEMEVVTIKFDTVEGTVSVDVK